jgi:hypothetical protein
MIGPNSHNLPLKICQIDSRDLRQSLAKRLTADRIKVVRLDEFHMAHIFGFALSPAAEPRR